MCIWVRGMEKICPILLINHTYYDNLGLHWNHSFQGMQVNCSWCHYTMIQKYISVHNFQTANLRALVTSSNMGAPVPIWGHHLQFWAPPPIRTPALILGHQFLFGETISNMGVPIPIWWHQIEFEGTSWNLGYQLQFEGTIFNLEAPA